MSTQQQGKDTDAVQQRFIALSRDLFFGMRARTVLRKLGHDLVLVNDEQKLLDAIGTDVPALVIVDFNQPVSWDVLAPLTAAEIPVIAFGAHTDVEGFRSAKAAGVDRVVSNGDFSRSLPDLVERYRKA
jgi:CheY-like chemotaxis protein